MQSTFDQDPDTDGDSADDTESTTDGEPVVLEWVCESVQLTPPYNLHDHSTLRAPPPDYYGGWGH